MIFRFGKNLYSSTVRPELTVEGQAHYPDCSTLLTVPESSDPELRPKGEAEG